MPIKVLIKGLNKVVEFADDTAMDVIEKEIKGGWRNIEKASGLPMDEVSRMERARFLGFDPDVRFIHESKNVGDISEIKPGGKFGGLFSLPDERAGYFDNVSEFILKGDVAQSGDIEDFAYSNYDKTKSWLEGRLREDLTDEQTETLITMISREEGLPVEGDEAFDEISGLLGSVDFADLFAETQKLRGELAGRAGFGAVQMADEFAGETVMLLPGNKVRNIKAAFDPSKTGSGGLFASLAGAATGLGGTPEAQAEEAADRLFMEGKARQDIKNESLAHPIENPLLHQIGIKLQESPQGFFLGGTGKFLETLGTGRQNRLTDESIRDITINTIMDFL